MADTIKLRDVADKSFYPFFLAADTAGNNNQEIDTKEEVNRAREICREKHGDCKTMNKFIGARRFAKTATPTEIVKYEEFKDYALVRKGESNKVAEARQRRLSERLKSMSKINRDALVRRMSEDSNHATNFSACVIKMEFDGTPIDKCTSEIVTYQSAAFDAAKDQDYERLLRSSGGNIAVFLGSQIDLAKTRNTPGALGMRLGDTILIGLEGSIQFALKKDRLKTIETLRKSLSGIASADTNLRNLINKSLAEFDSKKGTPTKGKIDIAKALGEINISPLGFTSPDWKVRFKTLIGIAKAGATTSQQKKCYEIMLSDPNPYVRSSSSLLLFNMAPTTELDFDAIGQALIVEENPAIASMLIKTFFVANSGDDLKKEKYLIDYVLAKFKEHVPGFIVEKMTADTEYGSELATLIYSHVKERNEERNSRPDRFHKLAPAYYALAAAFSLGLRHMNDSKMYAFKAGYETGLMAVLLVTGEPKPNAQRLSRETMAALDELRVASEDYLKQNSLDFAGKMRAEFTK